MSKLFTGDEIISDILLDFPPAHEILAVHGIACAGCHINQYETLRDGIVAHYGEELFITVIADLNEALSEETHAGHDNPPIITDLAKEKILQFQTDNQQVGYGFRVEITPQKGELSYFLDFEEHPERGDKIFESNGIKIFADPDSARLLNGKTITYQKKNEDEGFKFT